MIDLLLWFFNLNLYKIRFDFNICIFLNRTKDIWIFEGQMSLTKMKAGTLAFMKKLNREWVNKKEIRTEKGT